MTNPFDPRNFQLLPLGGAKASTNGDDLKPEPEDEDSTFQP
jgi:hypothetical protein